jgi:hydrogenase large subunit
MALPKIVVDPITRLEGHLGATIELGPPISGDLASLFPNTVGGNSQVFSTMYRGFENILKGRDPRDAIQITQRICGVCPVPHGMASTFAIENAMGYSPETTDPNTGHSSGPNAVSRLVRHLILGGEFMMSALTHFYALSALDLVQGPEMAPWTPFWDDSYYDPLLTAASGNPLTWTSGVPDSIRAAVVADYVLALRTRTKAIDIGAIFGGRLPIASCFTAGGVTKIPTQADINNARTLLADVSGFINNNYVPMTEIVGVLHGLADNTNNDWYSVLNLVGLQTSGGTNIRGPYSCIDYTTTGGIDLRHGIGIGRGCGNFYAAGGFDGDLAGTDNSGRVFPRGVVTGAIDTDYGHYNAVDPTKIYESIKYARYDEGTSGQYEDLWPLNGKTFPEPDKVGAYTWHKAPRYDGNVVEVGPFARMWVKGVYDITERHMDPDDSDGYCAGMHKHMTDHAFASAAWLEGGLPLPPLGTLGLTYDCGVSLIDRHRARAREAALIARKMIDWLNELEEIVQTPNWQHFYERYSAPDGVIVKHIAGLTAEGFGMAEAPRGAVHHWIKVKDGKIDNYQLQAPTTWNCSGRDSDNQPGPVEQALIGWPVRAVDSPNGIGEDRALVPVEALLVVHSFDPCIACSIHVVEPEDKEVMKNLKVEKGGVE